MNNNNQNNNARKEIAVRYKIDDNEIVLTPSIVQNYIVGSQAKITPVEFKFFTELCKVRKLNPFLNEAYLIKYTENQPAQLVVGKDAILKRALKNPKYDGMESGIIVINENGGVEERPGTFKLKNESLVGGWARVYRKDWKFPSFASVSFDEVSQKKRDGSLNSNWASKGATMVEKVAKVRALREAFVDDLGGMYDADEIDNNIQNGLQQEHGSNKIIIEQKEVETPEEIEENEEININDL